ncbi:MAG: response regulator [Algoriphagus sp.]|jgi:CheY-like chemotaxis protein|nr:response regulator [Algoriphagus sp.]
MNRNKTICIIEDDPNYLMLTKKMIEFTSLFQEILTYRNGKQAFEGLIEWKTKSNTLPDIILLDINMPIWDAWDFLDEFSKIVTGWDGIIYIITSSIDKVDEAKAQEYELVKGYLKKPVSFEKIIEIFNLN